MLKDSWSLLSLALKYKDEPHNPCSEKNMSKILRYSKFSFFLLAHAPSFGTQIKAEFHNWFAWHPTGHFLGLQPNHLYITSTRIFHPPVVA
jgi:hypothetical protein